MMYPVEALKAWLSGRIVGAKAPQVSLGRLPTGYDLVIPPWEITFQQSGDDNRTEGWRYITPSTSEIVTDPIYVGMLDDVYVQCIFGPHPTSGTTGRLRVYAPIAAGEDIWGRRQINPEGTNLNTFTLSNTSGATVVWFSPKNVHTNNLEFRQVIPPWLQFGIMTSNPQVPVTLMVYGR